MEETMKRNRRTGRQVIGTDESENENPAAPAVRELCRRGENLCRSWTFRAVLVIAAMCWCAQTVVAAERVMPQPVQWDNLQLGGELAERCRRNFDRLEEERFQPDKVFQQGSSWPGDTEGRTILGLVLDARASHRQPKYLGEILKRLPSKVNAQGFFGRVPAPGTADEQQLSGNGWLLRGLCEYYLWKHDARALESINRILDNLVLPTGGLHSQYPIDPANRIHGGGEAGTISRQIGQWLVSTDIGCDFIFMDGVIQAYAVTGRQELKPVIEEMISRYLEMDLSAIKAQTHASLTGMRALLRYYELTRNPKLLEAVVSRFKLYRERGMTENYENYNWFGRPESTEPCAVVDSYLVAVQLWQWTGQADYLELAEKIYYNALSFEQRANGGFGTQKCSGAGTPNLTVGSQEAYWCCTMRGAEGLAVAARSGFFTDAQGLYVVRFNPGKVKATFGDRGVLELQTETGYPFTGDLRLTVINSTLSFSPLVRIFAPSWISHPVVKLKGRTLKSWRENGFVCISEPLRAGDILVCEFDLNSGVLPIEGAASTAGWQKLHYGPLLLATEPASAPDLPEFPKIQMLADHTFRVDGLANRFSPIYHLLDPRVRAEPRYKVQMLFRSAAENAAPAPVDAAAREKKSGAS